MVTIRKLSAEESQRAFPGRAQQDLSEYVDALRDLAPGEAAGIERQGLSDRAIKRRLGQAANQRGVWLKWSRHSDPELLYFQVVGTAPAKVTNGRRHRRTAAPEPAPPTEPAAPNTGRGRRRQAAAARD